MKIVAVLLCCVLVAQATIFDSNIFKQWEEFKLSHKKLYGSHDEHEFRFKIFFDNLKKIIKHNQEYAEGKQTFTMGLNKYADLLNSEFVELMLKKVYDASDKLVDVEPLPKADLPDSVDWRAKGAVTDVKDQGHCGGCWAFSATGSIEGSNFLKNGKLISLSEQQLLDCSSSYGNGGCNGGLEYNGFQYIIDVGGIETEEGYPFEEKNGECRFDASKVAVTLSSYKHVKKNDEDELKNAVATIGPISIGIDAGSSAFQFYKSGVLNDKSCSSRRLNHSVLAVGYGVENGQEYWIVKNSWGASWGDNGYIKMARNSDNMCGVAADASYPIV